MRLYFLIILLLLLSCKQTAPQKEVDVYRIFGGERVTDNRYNFTVALSLPDRPFHCSGVLIAPTKVLTAAHCLVGHTLDEMHIVQETLSEIDDVKIHPRFDPTIKNSEFDFALLTLKTPLEADYPLIPNQELFAQLATEGATTTIIGYGRDQHGEMGALQSAEIGIFALKDNLLINFSIKISSCKGDSGGPQIITYEGKNYLLGIASTAYVDQSGECLGWNSYGRVDRINDLPL